jgi:hypothetical protein
MATKNTLRSPDEKRKGVALPYLDVEKAELEFGPIGRAEVEEQVERLVQHHLFRLSQRLPSFLRYVVDAALDDRQAFLKERTIGIDIFGRPADYDTSSDPIVRVTAAEIRKRLAQYYAEPGHDCELSITIPVGTYCPSFGHGRSRSGSVSATTEPSVPVPQTPEVPLSPDAVSVAVADVEQAVLRQDFVAEPPVSQPASRRRLWLPLLVGVLFVAVLGCWLYYDAAMRRNPLAMFWNPITVPRQRVMLCVSARPDPPTGDPPANARMVVSIDDLEALLGVASQLQNRGADYTLLGSNKVSLRDLREGPSVFVGAYDNQWTLRLTDGLRYYFARDTVRHEVWIQDRRSAQKSSWIAATSVASTTNYKDYAIAARFYDDSTGHYVVVAGGLFRAGTIAAGEFITQKANLEKLIALAPAGWARQNLEVVLSTEIIGGRPTPPRIEAVYFW